VNWGDAARFANWHNGQPTGEENANTTERGAYTLDGATTQSKLITVTRNSDARWFLPNENEWYKAAYHKNNGVTGDYWTYPTRSDNAPNNNVPSNDSGNSANYNGPSGITNGVGSIPLTDAGAYTLTASSYGTFDQGGNVKEWDESVLYGTFRALRGGGWNFQFQYLAASRFLNANPVVQESYIGFRIASSPSVVGDFNADGTIDASDYAVWRHNNGSAADYGSWRAHFGESVIGRAVLDQLASVPEQSSPALILIALATGAVVHAATFKAVMRRAVVAR
jgi:hypothetical protein